MVIADRVSEFVIDRGWPLMDPEGDAQQQPMDQLFAPALRQKASTMLSWESMAALRRGAAVRRELVQRLDEMATRQLCGKGIEGENLPWNGLTARGRTIVKRAAASNEKKPCERLTRDDAELLIDASHFLSTDTRLQGALMDLSAWLARAVSTHEVRHLADNDTPSPPSCVGCPPEMDDRARAEVSAYVASVAQPGVGYLAPCQACGVDLPTFHDNVGALNFALGVLMPEGCEAEPPLEQYAEAKLLAWTLFKRVESIELPVDFPQTLPIPATRIAAPSPGFEALAKGPVQTRHPIHKAFPIRTLHEPRIDHFQEVSSDRKPLLESTCITKHVSDLFRGFWAASS